MTTDPIATTAILRPGQSATSRARGAMLLDPRVVRARRDRDFCRVEAEVSFLVKERGIPARPVTVLTSVPAHGDDPLRTRLFRDAGQLVDAIVTSAADIPRAA